MLRDTGLDVLAKGHGGCAVGQIVTVDVEITQTASAALATAQTEAVCTGELQYWSATVAVDGTDRFRPGLARACGVATTRDGGAVTDTFEWCRDVTLVVQTYLPLVMRE
jgi:hypothetical protein